MSPIAVYYVLIALALGALVVFLKRTPPKEGSSALSSQTTGFPAAGQPMRWGYRVLISLGLTLLLLVVLSLIMVLLEFGPMWAVLFDTSMVLFGYLGGSPIPVIIFFLILSSRKWSNRKKTAYIALAFLLCLAPYLIYRFFFWN